MEDKYRKLSKEQFDVLRKCGTEPAFSGKLLHNKKEGTYSCPVCNNKLFSSKTKYDSGSGWPSFFKPHSKDSVNTKEDDTGRLEVTCKKCDSHLGHVFDDGPKPTGKRYCINSLSLKFKEEKK